MKPDAPFLIRPTETRDIPSLYSVRASTRQNAISAEQLIAWGITPESIAQGFAAGEFVGRVCEVRETVVGFCTGNASTGEIIVLAVLPEHEGKGVGLALLDGVVQELSRRDLPALWLACSPDPTSRSHGFYRANGWKPDGRTVENGDEVLVHGVTTG